MTLLLTLFACDPSAGGLLTGGNVVIVLEPPADLAIEPPGGLVQITKADGSDLPGDDREARDLGKLGFGGELRADLGQGAHTIDAIGDLNAHPGCDMFENPEIPQSQCYESGWYGYTIVEVLGPDWTEEEEVNADFTVAEGETATVTIELRPSCMCDD